MTYRRFRDAVVEWTRRWMFELGLGSARARRRPCRSRRRGGRVMARLRTRLPLANEWVELAGTILVVAAVLIGVIVLGVAIFGAPAGAETRPYHNLPADQLPDLTTVQFDGAGHAHLAGFNPDSGLVWHAATFHVPNPDVWDEQTVTVETTLPAGPFNLTLACEAGAAQVDVWLEGQDDAYVAATTLDCDTSCLNIAVPAPDDRTSVEQHDDAPCGLQPAIGAPSGQTGPVSGPVLSAANNTTPTTPPVGVVSSAAETTVAPSTVVSAAAALPNTGIDIRWFVGAAIVLLGLAAVLLLAGNGIARKDKRS